MGTCYLLCFDRHFKHARHYLGWTTDLDRRLREHATGAGAKLLRVLAEHGIGFQLVRTWEGGPELERELKRKDKGAHTRRCPLCRQRLRRQKGGLL